MSMLDPHLSILQLMHLVDFLPASYQDQSPCAILLQHHGSGYKPVPYEG